MSSRLARPVPSALACLAIVAVCITSLMCRAGFAESVDRTSARESGARALRDSARYPWYDAKSDQVRPVELRPYKAPRKSMDWEWRLQRKRRWGGWTAFWRVVQYLVWGILAIVFASLLYHLLKSLGLTYGRSELTFDAEHDSKQREAERIENLPFQVKQPRSDLLGEARRLYQTGNYQEAIIYLFSYQLVKLDEHHLIRLAKGKTNRQYLGELRGRAKLRPVLSRSMLAFEDVFFGHYALSKERFEACWNQLDEFHQIVQYQPQAH